MSGDRWMFSQVRMRIKMLIGKLFGQPPKPADKDANDYARSVYSSLDETKDDFKRLFNDTEEAVQDLGRTILRTLNPPPGPRALFSHQMQTVVRIRSVSQILERLIESRKRLTELAWEQEQFRTRGEPMPDPRPERLAELMREDAAQSERMTLDMESLFLFGGILLDQWALMVSYVSGLPSPHDLSFHKLTNKIENDSSNPFLTALKATVYSDLIWLDFHIRLFRNRFIVHPDRPWQRGSGRPVFGEKFTLSSPSPPGWLKPDLLGEEARAVADGLPEAIKERVLSQLGGRSDRAILRRLLNNIGLIQDRTTRDAIRKLVRTYGTSTPTFQKLGSVLLEFVLESTGEIRHLIPEHISLVNLGDPPDESSKNDGLL